MSKNISDAPIIFAQAGPLAGSRWNITNPLSIGRENGCDVLIDDRQVSRQHATISTSGDGAYVLTDLKSKNGTFINGHRIEEPVTLQDGDVIKIALIQDFLVISSDATIPMSEELARSYDRTGRLFIDTKAHRVWIADQEIIPPLSVPQYKLLECLYENQGSVVKREKVIDSVWGSNQAPGVTEQAVDALIRRTRERLSIIDQTQEYISTIRGIGFRLENPKFEI